MKLASFRYLFREGIRSIWQNRFMAIASVAVLVACLLLSGFAFLVLENVESMFDTMEEKNVVLVFAKTDCEQAELDGIEATLKGMSNVREVTFRSKEETLEKYGPSLPKETYESLQGENNPMSDAYIVSLKDLSKFEQSVAEMKQIEAVDEVSYDGGIAELLLKVRNLALTIGLWVMALLLAVSLFIIANTIKLTVYNRRLEIYIMRSVGATGAFIRIPFMIEGMVLGFVSAIFSYGIIWFLYDKLLGYFSTGKGVNVFQPTPFAQVWWILLVGFVLIGTLTGMIGSAIATGKYLHKEGSEKA